MYNAANFSPTFCRKYFQYILFFTAVQCVYIVSSSAVLVQQAKMETLVKMLLNEQFLNGKQWKDTFCSHCSQRSHLLYTKESKTPSFSWYRSTSLLFSKCPKRVAVAKGESRHVTNDLIMRGHVRRRPNGGLSTFSWNALPRRALNAVKSLGPAQTAYYPFSCFFCSFFEFLCFRYKVSTINSRT